MLPSSCKWLKLMAEWEMSPPSLSGHSLFLEDTRYERADPTPPPSPQPAPLLQETKLQAGVVKPAHPLPGTLQLEQLRIFTLCVTQVWMATEVRITWWHPSVRLHSIALPSPHQHSTKITTGLCLLKSFCFSSQTSLWTRILFSARTHKEGLNWALGDLRESPTTHLLFLSTHIHFLTWNKKNIRCSQVFKR